MNQQMREKYSSMADLLTCDMLELEQEMAEGLITADDIGELVDASVQKIRIDEQQMIDTSMVFPLFFSRIMTTSTCQNALHKLGMIRNPMLLYDVIVSVFHAGIDVGVTACIELELYKTKPEDVD